MIKVPSLSSGGGRFYPESLQLGDPFGVYEAPLRLRLINGTKQTSSLDGNVGLVGHFSD